LEVLEKTDNNWLVVSQMGEKLQTYRDVNGEFYQPAKISMLLFTQEGKLIEHKYS